MQAASGWAPLSRAVRFTPVFYLWMLMVVRLHVGWDSPSTRGTPSSRCEPPNRRFVTEPSGVARLSSRQTWPGCRAARSPGVVLRGPATEPPGRCLAIELLLCRPPGRLCGRSRPIRSLRVPAVPKRTAACGRPAVRKLVVLSAFIARTGTAVALAREVKADFQLVGCLRSRSGLQL